MLRRVRVGASEEEAVVGMVALGGPDLLTVDDPLVTVEHCRRLQAGQIRAGVRLAEALTPTHRAVQDLGKELLLLLLRAPLQDRRTDQGVTEEVRSQRRLRAGELLRQHNSLHRRQSLAAVFGGPRGADPTTFEEFGRPRAVELLALLRRHLEFRVEPVRWQVVLQPSAD